MYKKLIEILSINSVQVFIGCAAAIGLFAAISNNSNLTGAADGKNLYYNLNSKVDYDVKTSPENLAQAHENIDLLQELGDRLGLSGWHIYTATKVFNERICNSSVSENGSRRRHYGRVINLTTDVGRNNPSCRVAMRPFGCNYGVHMFVGGGGHDNFTEEYDTAKETCRALRQALLNKAPVSINSDLMTVEDSDHEYLKITSATLFEIPEKE